MNWDEREVELKFAVNAALAERIFVQLNSARTAPRRLESTYFDTADQALRKAGFTARVRKDGSRWTQTVKSRMAVDGVGRGEWEAPAKGCVLDADFVRTTPAATALGGSSLEPLFSVCVQRRSVALNEPGCAIEASFDKGSAKRSGRFAVFSELELELKSGAPTAFFELARRWRNAFALRPGFTTKADRGFALISGEGRGPRPFEAPRIHPDMTAGAAFKAIAMAALEQIAGNADALGKHPEEEAIHQLRVGARRLRSAISTFKPIIVDKCVNGVKSELKRLSGELDPARNLDVFLSSAYWRAPPKEAQSAQGRAREQRIRRLRKIACARARGAAASDQFSALLLELLIWIEVGPWTEPDAEAAVLRDRPISEFAAAALERQHRQLVERARDFDHMNREKRHKLRIQAKTLRYGADVFAGLFSAHPNRTRRFMARIETLLDCLGELNDMATGEGLLGKYYPRPLRDGQASRERKLVDSARKALKRFRTTKRWWPNRPLKRPLSGRAAG